MKLRLIFIPVVDICVLETQAHSNMTFKNAAIINSGITSGIISLCKNDSGHR